MRSVIEIVHAVSIAHRRPMILRLVHDGSIKCLCGYCRHALLIAIRNCSDVDRSEELLMDQSGPRSWGGSAGPKTRVNKRPASSVELRAPGRHRRILSRGAANVEGLIGDGADGEGERSFLQRGVGVDAPDWASHCVQTLMPSFEALKLRMGNRIRIVCWADCGGLGVELIALDRLAARLGELLHVRRNRAVRVLRLERAIT